MTTDTPEYHAVFEQVVNNPYATTHELLNLRTQLRAEQESAAQFRMGVEDALKNLHHIAVERDKRFDGVCPEEVREAARNLNINLD
ncbi:hypothetical protein [Hymenobacter koreensis]|uniref:Uncharacterized protein n=1 Tax=Hymenobacter koreensis TaxID=1084523 RepID=A0ABP8JK57_9BACT